MQLDISAINKVLKDIDGLGTAKGFTRQSITRTHTGIPEGYDEGNQGDFNEDTSTYTHVDLPENVLVQIVTQTDSYGYNDKVVSVQFGKAVKKEVQVFEAIS